MKIFIDFDDVIFHAKKFRKDLIGVFARHGITKREFESSYYYFGKKEESDGKYYHPKEQIKVLKKRFKIDNAGLEKDLDSFLSDLSGYIFPDVPVFLQSFRREDLYLVTYGHLRFQRKKIKNSGIGKCFKKVLVCRGDKISVILKTCKEDGIHPSQEDVILIDDHPEQIKETEEKKKMIKTFHMCRPQGRFSDLICLEKDFEVKNLKEAAKIIKKEEMR